MRDCVIYSYRRNDFKKNYFCFIFLLKNFNKSKCIINSNHHTKFMIFTMINNHIFVLIVSWKNILLFPLIKNYFQ